MANRKTKAMANIQITNPNLETFSKGFNHFSNMNMMEDKIIYKTAYGYAADAVLAAQKRINELCLPLRAYNAGHPLLSNTFVVKPAEDNSFERLSEQLGVCHA